MPSAKVFTATYDRVRNLAEEGLRQPEGIYVEFKPTHSMSLDGCRHAARRIQQVFTSMRAKDRRVQQRKRGESKLLLDGAVKSRYDELSCYRDELPDGRGWRVYFVRGAMVDWEFAVISNQTGEPVEAFSEETRIYEQCDALVWQGIDNNLPFPLSMDQTQWLLANNAKWLELNCSRWDWKYFLRTGQAPAIDVAYPDEEAPKPFDLADLEGDDVFGDTREE